MRVAEPQGETAAFEARGQVHDPEHAHAVARDRVLVPDHADLPEAEGLGEPLDYLDVRDRLVRCGSRRRRHLSEFGTRELCAIGYQRRGGRFRRDRGLHRRGCLLYFNGIRLLHSVPLL